jgi:uncharacterized protein YjiS (DUF1127 family)
MLHELSNAIREWRKRRQAVRELSAMPDYLLNDIGIERHAINDVVHGLQTRQRQATPNARSRQPMVDGRIALN